MFHGNKENNMSIYNEAVKNYDLNMTKLPLRTFEEHAFHMGYPAGNLSGLNWGVFDHYGFHAREQKKGTHLLDRNIK